MPWWQITKQNRARKGAGPRAAKLPRNPGLCGARCGGGITVPGLSGQGLNWRLWREPPRFPASRIVATNGPEARSVAEAKEVRIVELPRWPVSF